MIDGGWAWIVCLGCFVVNCILGGLMYSFGIMYVELLGYFQSSKARTALTLSILQGIANGTGPLNAIIINRFGCRLVSCFGTLLQFCGYVISVRATSITFLYFSFGLLGGLGNGMIYLSMLVALGKYFDKRRPLATGISVSGVGIGTFILGPLTKRLVEEYTWKGTMLVHGGITLNCLVCSLLYVPLKDSNPNKRREHSGQLNRQEVEDVSQTMCKDRIPGRREVNGERVSEHVECTDALLGDIDVVGDKEEHLQLATLTNQPCQHVGEDPAHFKIHETTQIGRLTNIRRLKQQIEQYLKLLRNVPFIMTLFAITFTFLGQIIPYMYIVDTVRIAGVGDAQASWLLASLGISDTIGRALYGLIANFATLDLRIAFILSQVVSGTLTLLLPFVGGFGLMVALCVPFGLISGGSCTLTMVLLSHTVGNTRTSEAFGMYCLSCGFALFFGYPLAGWLFDATQSYIPTYVFAAVTMFLSALLVGLSKLYSSRSDRLRRSDDVP